MIKPFLLHFKKYTLQNSLAFDYREFMQIVRVKKCEMRTVATVSLQFGHMLLSNLVPVFLKTIKEILKIWKVWQN